MPHRISSLRSNLLPNTKPCLPTLANIRASTSFRSMLASSEAICAEDLEDTPRHVRQCAYACVLCTYIYTHKDVKIFRIPVYTLVVAHPQEEAKA